MENKDKQPSISDLMKIAASDVYIKNHKKLEDPFNAGSKIVSAKQLDVDRFGTFNSKTYGKLGFDPFRDNNKTYNENTHWSEDIGRATTGMFKLAKVGFQDTFGFGITAEKDNYKNFENVMKNYSSTRGGYTQFWANTQLSAGYTVGILGAIAAEEIGLALTTSGLGNIGTSGLVGAQLGSALARMNKVSRSSKYIDRIAELGHTDEAAKFFSVKGLGQNLGKLGEKLNPLGETANFIRQTKLDEFSDLNSLQKLSIGAGALAKDARKIYMTHSESKMEAEMARDEFKNKAIEKARLENADSSLTDADIKRIDTDASNVYNSTYMGNLGLIYATNALTFDNMFKSMRYTNKMFSIPGKLTTTLGKDGLVVKAVKGFSAKRALATGKKAVMDFSAKESAKKGISYVAKNYKVAGAKLLEKGLSNSVEGIQELGQDVISNSVLSYYGRNHAGKQIKGGFLENMYQAASDFSLKDVGTGIVDMATTVDKKGNRSINQDGLSTFGGGFFMGTIASPFGATIGAVQNQVVGGGIKSKIDFMVNRDQFVKNQKNKYKESAAKAKVLTQIFNDNLGSFLDHSASTIVTQSELQEQILDAAEKGDKKGFEDGKHDSFQQGMKKMLKNNSEGMFTDFLDDMSSNYSPEQLNQAMGRTDITSDNVAEYKTKLKAKSESIKNLRKTYDKINNEVINPVRQSDIDRLDASVPEQRKEKLELMIYKKAWDNLKEELLFNHGKIANKAQRMIELEKQLKKETDLSPTEVQALISKESLGREIKILETQVEANKNLNLTGSDAKAAQVAESKFTALKKYQVALTSIDKAESASKPNYDTIDKGYSDLFEAYHEFRSVDDEYGAFYGRVETEEVKRENSKKSFDAIVDYLDLKSESQALQSVVNTLVDTKSANMWVDRNAEMMADLDANKETHIANQLQAYTEKAESSEMLTQLQEAGLFFDLNEIDDLIEKGVMPSQIYNIETSKPASKDEYQKAQDLISSFYKNLTGKTITQNKAVQSKTSLRYDSDTRMVEDLLSQYGIELDTEIDLSDDAQLNKLLKKLKASKFLTYIDKEILDVVSDSTPKIKFTTSGEYPIQINEDGVITIDLRYAASDYKNAAVNFETLVLSALTQAKLTDNLDKNKDLKTEVKVLMKQAREAFSKKYPTMDVEKISMLNNTAEFLSESLNNASFQKFLGGITDTVSGTKKSVWTSLMAKIIKAFGQTFDKSVLQRAVSLANIALDEKVVDSIDEKNETPTTPKQKDEELEPVSSVEKNGFKLMEVVPGMWQVTGNGEVKAFDTKEEAENYFNENAVPPTKTVKQTVKEKIKRTVTLGNTDFIKNASDRPDIFGEFMHPEIVSDNNLKVDEWTKRIVEIGAELDAAGVSDWTYGDIRVDIDDRLVIDVTAEVPEMGTKETTTNTPNAEVVKLKKELAEIKLKITNLSTSTGRYNELLDVKAREEFQKELDVVNFSRNKFSGNKMPLYQYLRMLNATKPVVGQFAHFIDRNRTNDPQVIKLGVVTSVNDNSFTYTDKNGKSQTRNTEDKTKEFGNSYFLFSESEIKKELTYEEAIQVAQERFNKKVDKLRANAPAFRTDEKSLLEYWDKTVNGNIGTSPFSKEFLKDLRKKALNQLDKEAQENKKMFGKVQAPTKQDVEKRAQKLFLDVVESNRQYTNVFDWNVFDALGGMSSKFKSSDAADLLLVGDVRDNLESHDFKFYENFNEKGERYVSILVPISDPTNPTRSAKFAAISIGIPDTMTAAEIANPILEEAKKLSANSAVTTTAQMKDMAIPMAKKILRDKFEGEYNRTDTSSKELDELENKKKELEEKLSTEPESIEFTDTKNVQTGTKTVKFLMYKSTGTGSSAESKGEWVPLIAFGKHPDGSEWFVKARHEGQDPKFNKYGSKTFAAIDQDLKNKEKELFKGKKSTQEIEEEVDREIDVEVPADTEESPEAANERMLDEEDELKNEINSKRELLKRVNEQIAATSRLNFRKINKLDVAKKQLLLDIRSLQEKLDFTYGSSSVISTVTPTEGTPVETTTPVESEFDLDDNVIITQFTRFNDLPYKLQEDLLEQYRMDIGSAAVGAVRFKYKKLINELEALNLQMSQTEGDELDALDEKYGEVYDDLIKQVGSNINIRLNEQGKIEVSTVGKTSDATAEEIATIESKMANDIIYMRTIMDYNNGLESVEPEVEVIPGLTPEQELARAKQIKQELLDKQREIAKARRRARKEAYVPITAMEREQVVELLKKIFKTDFDVLSKSDLDYLVDNLLSDSKSSRFKIPDAIAFLNKKKLDYEARSQFEFINEQFSEELSKLRAQERADAVKVYQKDIFEEMVDNRFDYNYDIIKTGVKNKKIFSVTYNGKTHKFTLSPKEFRALVMYNQDIFKKADSKENLLIQIHTALRNVKYYADNYKKNLKFEGTPQEIEDKLIEMYFMLGKKGLLLPAVVRSINYALYNADVNLTIIESNVLTGQAYTIEARASVAKRAQPVTKLAEAKEFIANYVHTEEAITSEYWQEALVAEWFFNPNNRINPEFIKENFSRGAGEKTAYKSFMSDKSEYISLDGLSDAISQDYQDRMVNADVNLQDAIKSIFDNYTTVTDMIMGVAESLKNNKEEEAKKSNKEYEEEEAAIKKIANSIMSEEDNDIYNEYINSLEYKIENGLLDTEKYIYDSLTDYQKFLYDRALEDGAYPTKEKPTEKPVEKKPVDLFEEGLNEMAAKQTSINKEEMAVRTEIKEIKNSFDIQKALLAKISDISNDGNLKMFIAIYKIVNDEPALNVFNADQRNILNDRLNKRLKQGAFIKQSVSLNNKIYQIVSYDVNNETMEVADIKTGEIENIPFTDFANINDVLEAGQEIINSKLNTEVKDQEIEIIKDAYKDIFSNFAASVSEFETINEADLNSKIIEQLTKCK